MTTVAVNGVVAEVAGEGPAVVMVHGLGGTSNAFQPQMEALRSYRVVRIDLPGSGRSPLPAGEASFAAFASPGCSGSSAPISLATRSARSFAS